MYVIKASGEQEKFDKRKIFRTAIKAGASKEFASEVANKIERQIRKGITTREILQLALRYLKKNRKVAERYSLKKALMELGPAGYFFEKYFAKVLEYYGYETKVGISLKGKVINQEVDILARKKDVSAMIECKYHNSWGNYSKLKVALYTYARYLDIKKYVNEAWLVTNTKCSMSAIKYARGVDLKIISWGYPKKGNLQDLIEEKGLYPITVLLSARGHIKNKLSEAQIVLVKEIAEKDISELRRKTKLSEKELRILKKDAIELIG